MQTYLRSFLSSTRLRLREGGRRGLLACFGRLSLRKEDHQRIMFTKCRSSLNSRESTSLHCCGARGSSLFSSVLVAMGACSHRGKEFMPSGGGVGILVFSGQEWRM